MVETVEEARKKVLDRIVDFLGNEPRGVEVKQFFSDPQMTKAILEDLFFKPKDLKAFLLKKGSTDIEDHLYWKIGEMTNPKAIRALKRYCQDLEESNLKMRSQNYAKEFDRQLTFLKDLRTLGKDSKKILMGIREVASLLRRKRILVVLSPFPGGWHISAHSRIFGFKWELEVGARTDLPREIKRMLRRLNTKRGEVGWRIQAKSD